MQFLILFYIPGLSDVLSLIGVSPVQAIALVYNAVMGWVSMPIVNWLKVVLAKIPFLPSEQQKKISGWFVPVLSTLVGLLFVYIGQWIFGISLFTEPNFWTNLITALGLNAKVASMVFEYLKSKKG